jgi:hypothetical protein
MHLKRCVSLVAVGCGALASAAAAQEARAQSHSWELTASGRTLDTGEHPAADFRYSSGDVDSRRSELSATFYFAPVDETEGPYGLADFFARKSRVTATLRTEDAVFQTVDFAIFSTFWRTSTDETDGYSVDGRFVAPNSGWYVGGAFASTSTDRFVTIVNTRQGVTTGVDSFQAAGTEAERAELSGGKYLGAATLLEFTLGSSKLEQSSGSVLPFIDAELDDWSVGLLHVRQARALTYSLFGRVFETEWLRSPPPPVEPPVQLSDPTPTRIFPPVFNFGEGLSFTSGTRGHLRTYSLGSELFPTRRLGVSIGYTTWAGDTVRDEAYGLVTTWFVRKDLALSVVLNRTNQDVRFQDRVNIDVAEVRLIGRL